MSDTSGHRQGSSNEISPSANEHFRFHMLQLLIGSPLTARPGDLQQAQATEHLSLSLEYASCSTCLIRIWQPQCLRRPRQSSPLCSASSHKNLQLMQSPLSTSSTSLPRTLPHMAADGFPQPIKSKEQKKKEYFAVLLWHLWLGEYNSRHDLLLDRHSVSNVKMTNALAYGPGLFTWMAIWPHVKCINPLRKDRLV